MADFAIVPRYVRANPDVCTAVPLRPAPRVPAGLTSLAASAAPSRRGILGAMVAVSSLAAMPALAAAPKGRFELVYADYMRAKIALDTSPSGISRVEAERLGDAFCQAYDRLCEEPCATPRDFCLKFTEVYDSGGAPVEETRLAMLQEAQRLIAQGR